MPKRKSRVQQEFERAFREETKGKNSGTEKRQGIKRTKEQMDYHVKWRRAARLSNAIKQFPRISLNEKQSVTFLTNAPVVLADLCRRMKRRDHIAGNDPGKATRLLECLLTNKTMIPVWDRIGEEIRELPPSKQDMAYHGIWDAIHYGLMRFKSPIASRRELTKAILDIGRGLKLIGKAIAPSRPCQKASAVNEKAERVEEEKYWAGVPSLLLWKCFPDELAEILGSWASYMSYDMSLIAQQAMEKARTALADKRPVDRNSYDWSAFVRILQNQWPQTLRPVLTYNTLAKITHVVFPGSAVNAQQVRDTLRRTPPRQSR